jgi:membrane-associated phospholipid phosphatase
VTAGSERARRHGSRLHAAAITAAAAFVGLALLVAAGHLARIDSFAVRHLMPDRPAHESKTSLLGSLLSYHGHHFHAAAVVKLPASALLSSMIVAAASVTLWRRGRHRSALVWFGAFALGTAVELFCKTVITRPALYGVSDGTLVHLAGFDSSFPSGHVVRGALLVAVAASAWPLLRPLLAAWAVALLLILELYGVHTPSDILGGLLLAGALVLAVLALERRRASGREGRRNRTAPDLAGLYFCSGRCSQHSRQYG